MSINVTTSAGSLISLGMSIGDVTTLFTLGRRLGNWVTAQSGDTDLLTLLQTDEPDLLQRRGMLEIAIFNKRWARRARLMMNGKPTELVGVDAAKILGEMSRFTASMVSIVAGLDGFMAFDTLKEVMKRLLKELLRTTEYGEDILSSQLQDRVRAWRSAAYVRSMSTAVQVVRSDMIRASQILDGYMPAGDASEMAQFLAWLLAGNTEVFTTASSDVAGVAVAISQLAFDMLEVEGWGARPRQSQCRVVCMPNMMATTALPRELPRGWANRWRAQSTIVPLNHPEEAFSTFPVTAAVANAARQAWLDGKVAAQSVGVRLQIPMDATGWHDLEYRKVDLGSPPQRVGKEIFALAQDYGICVNAELCARLTTVFERTSVPILEWLHDQCHGNALATGNVGHVEMVDQDCIDAFTVQQAFFYGYYHAVFLPLVDTSSLAIPAVDGAWGYRDNSVMQIIRSDAILHPLTRQNLQSILSALLFSHVVHIPSYGRARTCLGVIGKRALLVNSLVGASDSLHLVGSFRLLDVDVGGIPCDSDGLIYPGESPGLDSDYGADLIPPGPVGAQAAETDFTKHIEPDWDVNPERILLVMRYKGRRVLSLNPSMTDVAVCVADVGQADEPAVAQTVPHGVAYTIQDFMSGKVIYSSDRDVKIVVQSRGMPSMRYAQ